jgi:hypothetical protein
MGITITITTTIITIIMMMITTELRCSRVSAGLGASLVRQPSGAHCPALTLSEIDCDTTGSRAQENAREGLRSVLAVDLHGNLSWSSLCCFGFLPGTVLERRLPLADP